MLQFLLHAEILPGLLSFFWTGNGKDAQTGSTGSTTIDIPPYLVPAAATTYYYTIIIYMIF